MYSNTYLTQEVAKGALGGAHRGGIRPNAVPTHEPGPMTPVPGQPDRGVMTVDIRTALKQVIDPELGIDIVDLGMVRGIEQEGDKATSRSC